MNYRVSVFMYFYKKFIWKEKNIQFIAPTEYEPNEVWQEILNIDVSDMIKKYGKEYE